MSARRTLLLVVAAALLAGGAFPLTQDVKGQDSKGAQWIWGGWTKDLTRPPGERCYFRKVFTIPHGKAVAKATLQAACDDHFAAFVNGARVAAGDTWSEWTIAAFGQHLVPGRNVLAVEGWNDGAPAGLLLTAVVELKDGGRLVLESDASFETLREGPEGWNSLDFTPKSSLPARVLGPHGMPPWGLVKAAPEPSFRAPPGFHVRTEARGVGSLLALASDGKGGLYVGREGAGILHLARTASGAFEPSGRSVDELTFSHGLCWTDGALYATGEGPKGAGLYKATWPKAGAPPVLELLGGFVGPGGEHGVHGVVKGPDGRLYIAVGNHHRIAVKPSAGSPFQAVYEGAFEPFLEDPLGHAVGIRAPGGTVVSVDLDGKDWRLVAGGFRNHYDVSFNVNGDLFTFDSDMEWDVGLPWYRAVRVVHVVDGGEYGWRSGAACWPDYYADSLPPAAETGRGSPTGLTFYDGAKFPRSYRGSLLLADWSKGEILTCRLTPAGTTYRGSTEVLLSGSPLAVTDLVVDIDGSVLFTTGGRGTRGGVYRLTYDGPMEPVGPSPPFAKRPPAFSDLTSMAAGMGSDDRYLRFRAARAFEASGSGLEALRGPASDRVKGEMAVALARRALTAGDGALADNVFRDAMRLLTTSGSSPAAGDLTEARLAYLRAVELALQHPKGKAKRAAKDLLLPLTVVFPTGERRLDRELAALLAVGSPPGTVEKLLAKLEAEPSRAEAIHYAYWLRIVKDGWTPESRNRFLTWMAGARAWTGGASFAGYLDNILLDMKGVFSDEELARAAAPPPPKPADVAAGEPKDFDATLAFLELTRDADRRNAGEGARLYKQLCARCHLLGAEGGRVGPDLTTVAGRFTLGEQLLSSLRPSAVVSDQYRAFELRTRDRQIYSGLKAGERDGAVSLVLGSGEIAKIPLTNVESLEPSPLSLMPEGLLDALTLEEVADLFAYVNKGGAAGRPDAAAWRPLFDGKTLDGWEGEPELWSVERGCIAGRAKGLPGSRFLVSKGEFADFILEFDVKLMTGNSGLQFRAASPAPFVLTGYQADVGQAYWGALYEEGGRGMLAQPANEIWTSIVKPRDFNHYVVSAIGARLRIEVNGVVTVDLEDRASSRGRLGFQLHGGIDNDVRIRNVRILEPNGPSSGAK